MLDTPKIHVEDPLVDNHAIVISDHNLRIPLQLHGIFSYFPMSKPTDIQLQDSDNASSVIAMTLDGPWNPHSRSYAKSESSMIDWQGNMVEPKDRV